MKIVVRDWGTWQVLTDRPPTIKTKSIQVHPGRSLSLQRHSERSETWLLRRGKGAVWLDDHWEDLIPNTWIEIPVGTWHQLVNIGTEDLIVYEIQHGTRCVEEDIERAEKPLIHPALKIDSDGS